MKTRGKKGQLVWDTLVPWVVALVVLVLIVVFYLVLKDKGISALEFFKNLWRFR